jgi:hypothetical protein
MIRNLSIRNKSIAALVVALAATGVVIGLGSSGGAANVQSLPFDANYQPLPSSLITMGGVQLNQLDASQIATVAVSPETALSAAESFADVVLQSGVTDQVSLGSFTDSTLSEKLPSGSYGFVATGVPSYVVTFSGLSLPTLSGNEVVSHESVIVNAVTGLVIEGIKFY